MILLEPNKSLVETPGEFPPLPKRIRRLYLDLETTSNSDNEDSTNPWHNCEMLGFAITWDDMQMAYYIPMRHKQGPNVDVQAAYAYLVDALRITDVWVNQNVKYDGHVVRNETGYDISNADDSPIIHCTLQQAKVLHSDRLSYSLDALAKDWLNKDITPYEREMRNLYLGNSEDYARVPPYFMGKYAGEDVITNRQLDQYIQSKMPDECKFVSKLEVGVTKMLLDMENIGFGIDNLQLRAFEYRIATEQYQRLEKIYNLIGYHMNPNSGPQLYELICNRLGYPIMEYTDAGNASFGKTVLAAYARRCHTPEHKVLIETVADYRHWADFDSDFLQAYMTQEVDGILHPWYNQILRTGRMSAVRPNLMAVSGEAKNLIHPREGMAFLSVDYSQIEFRLIAHFTQDKRLIKAYNDDYDTDMHAAVAEWTRTPRKHAKKVNFTVSYGGGIEVLLAALYLDPELVEATFTMIAGQNPGLATAEIERLVNAKMRGYARELLRIHGREIPWIKATSNRAATVCANRGYIKNIAGRHRHIPKQRSHIAFNTIMQSSAADIVKERMLAVWAMLKAKGYASRVIGQVHDELLFQGPIAEIESEEFLYDVLSVMEYSPFPSLRVPLRCSYGTSRTTWKEASTAVKDGGNGEKKADRRRVEENKIWGVFTGV